jgi:hypothetical protein
MFQEIFEFLFQTDSIFNNVILDWLIPALIVVFLYDVAFGIIGGLYSAGFISGSGWGSLFHWLIRYGIMWVVVQTIVFIKISYLWLFLVGILLIGITFLAILIRKQIDKVK